MDPFQPCAVGGLGHEITGLGMRRCCSKLIPGNVSATDCLSFEDWDYLVNDHLYRSSVSEALSCKSRRHCNN